MNYILFAVSVIALQQLLITIIEGFRKVEKHTDYNFSFLSIKHEYLGSAVGKGITRQHDKLDHLYCIGVHQEEYKYNKD